MSKLVKPVKVTLKHKVLSYIKAVPTTKERGACQGCAFHTTDILDMEVQEDDPCKTCNF